LGATGYIGGNVARAFAERGFKVTALSRTEEKAKQLRRNEIATVIGTAQNVSSWQQVAENSDIIVEALSDFADHTTGTTVLKALESILKKDHKKIVIYTSGVWIYGNTTQHADESAKFDKLIPIITGRDQMEKGYQDAGAIVVRPGVVYGKEGSLTGIVAKAIKEGKPDFSGTGLNHWALVHVSDLADAYVRVVERGHSIKGQVFNLVSQSESVGDIARAFAKESGYKGEIKFHAPSDPFSDALALDQKHISSQKARLVLGWHPTHPSLVAGAAHYYKVWESFN